MGKDAIELSPSLAGVVLLLDCCVLLIMMLFDAIVFVGGCEIVFVFLGVLLP